MSIAAAQVRPEKSENELTRVDTRADDYRSHETALRDALLGKFVPEDEVIENLALFLTPQHLRRMLFFYEIYQQILEVPGVVMQFGVRWGREIALLDALRTTFEPFNHSRRIVGFDTFEGYAGIHERDGGAAQIQPGNLTTRAGFEGELETLLRHREQLSPLGHVKKFDLIKGDVAETVPAYFEKNPHTVISFAHIDLNLYQPARQCLEAIKPYLTKGSVIAIDEVNLGVLPGETIALREVFGLNEIRLKRHPSVNPTWPAYFVLD